MADPFDNLELFKRKLSERDRIQTDLDQLARDRGAALKDLDDARTRGEFPKNSGSTKIKDLLEQTRDRALADTKAKSADRSLAEIRRREAELQAEHRRVGEELTRLGPLAGEDKARREQEAEAKKAQQQQDKQAALASSKAETSEALRQSVLLLQQKVAPIAPGQKLDPADAKTLDLTTGILAGFDKQDLVAVEQLRRELDAHSASRDFYGKEFLPAYRTASKDFAGLIAGEAARGPVAPASAPGSLGALGLSSKTPTQPTPLSSLFQPQYPAEVQSVMNADRSPIWDPDSGTNRSSGMGAGFDVRPENRVTSDPVLNARKKLAEMTGMSAEAINAPAGLRSEPLPGDSLAQFLQRPGPGLPENGTYASVSPIPTKSFPSTQLSTLFARGQTPPTPTLSEAEAHVPEDMRRSEAFREGRYFTNIGTPGGADDIRRVLPAGQDPLIQKIESLRQAFESGDTQGPIQPGSFITHEDLATTRELAPKLTDAEAGLEPERPMVAQAEPAPAPEIDPEALTPDVLAQMREAADDEARAEIVREAQRQLEEQRRLAEEEERRRQASATG